MNQVKRTSTVVIAVTMLAMAGSFTPASAYTLEEFKQCLADAKDNSERSECMWKRQRSVSTRR